jgi:hypothetical protein
MGEKQSPTFQLSFNTSLKIDFQESGVTSDGGLILVRELDKRSGLGDLIAQRLTESRAAKNTQLPLADQLRQSVYSRIAGYENFNDVERLSQDPTFRFIGSEKVWERGVALTSWLESFECTLPNWEALVRSCRPTIWGSTTPAPSAASAGLWWADTTGLFSAVTTAANVQTG